MKTITEYIQKKHFTKETDYVDLGLPSGTKWATMNIGAERGNKPEDWCGLYFVWGETEGYKASDKHDFNWDTYKFGTQDNLTKYFKKDKLTKLTNEDDVVYQYTKGEYRMPTYKELEELHKNTEHKWVTNYKGIKELNGILFIGKNDNTLFIPASGSLYNSSNTNYNDHVDLWSSDVDKSDYNFAYSFYAMPERSGIGISYRSCGSAVRGVLN